MPIDRNDRFLEVTAPATPSAGSAVAYVKSDGILYWKDDAGNEYACGFEPAAFVDPSTATAEAIADALIAAGLMAAS